MLNELIDELKDDEGFEGMPYKDILGYDTIGFGTLLPLTRYEATMLLKARLEDKIRELNSAKPIIKTMPHKVRKVLYNMAYQLGTTKLLQFKRMWIAVEKEDWEEMAIEMKDSRWYKQTTNRAESLISIIKG
jgi:lysozyme